MNESGTTSRPPQLTSLTALPGLWPGPADQRASDRGREGGGADLADGLVEGVELRLDTQPGRAGGQVDGGLQAETDVVQGGDDRIEEFLAAMGLLGAGGDVPDHGQGQPAGLGRERAEADLGRERGRGPAPRRGPAGRPRPGAG